jgi:8-oxo-dGTP pyrophosphatase MutT (NUDIX family)
LPAFLCLGFFSKPQNSMNDFAAIRQQLQARLLRLDRLQIEPASLAQAAVTLILRAEAATPEALIIKRAEHPRDPWSGHLALPGGRADAMDADLLATAARETCEEIGIDLLAGGEFIGRLPKLTPNNPRLPQIEITPFVALAPPQFRLQLSAEVAEAFWISLPQLKRDGMSSRHTLKHAGVESSWPAYPSMRGPIWGITGRILTDFLRLLD